MANLSVVIAFFFRIGTEETAAFSAGELKSIVTFGSRPFRIRAPLHSTVADIETTTDELDASGGELRTGGDTEALPKKPVLLADV